MSSTWKMFKEELRLDLVSLKFWAIAFFCLLLSGFFFFNLLDSYMGVKQLVSKSEKSLPSFEKMLSAFFAVKHVILLMIMPAISMGSFSGNTPQTRNRFFLCAPVKPLSVVLAKYLSNLSLVLGVLFATLIYPIFLSFFSNPDWGQVLGSYIGLFGIAISHVSVCLFVSSLTYSPFFAFIFSLVVMLGLFLLSSLSMLLPNEGLVSSFLQYMSVSTHLEPFFRGQLSVSHVSYFLCIGIGMILLTSVSYTSRRWS